MKFRKKYTKKKYTKHTRKRKYKQKHKRTHKRKGLKKRKRTRRKRGGARFLDFITGKKNPEESRKLNDGTFTTTYNATQEQQERRRQEQEREEQQEVAVNNPAAVIKDLAFYASQEVRDQMTKPIDNNTPIHIIFSHKGRMQCLLNSLHSKEELDMDNINGSAEEPANGGIIVLARTPSTYKGFYHNSQYKSSKGQDMNAFFEAFKQWWEELEATLAAENEASAAAAAARAAARVRAAQARTARSAPASRRTPPLQDVDTGSRPSAGRGSAARTCRSASCSGRGISRPPSRR